MGFSTSGAAVVLFVGLLVGLATLLPTMDVARERVSEASEDRNERMLREANTDIEIANVTYDGGTDTLTVAVNNTGARTLSTNETSMLVDGVIEEPANVAVAGTNGRETWTPGTQATFTFDYADDPSRVKVVTKNGIARIETGV